MRDNKIDKRGPITVSDTKVSWVVLNLLEIVLDKKRKTIQNECSKQKINLSDYNQVSLYIKNKLK